MKTVFVADKRSYGTGMMHICSSLLALKKAIVKQELYFDDRENRGKKTKYTEELFERFKKKGEYTLYKVELDPSEKISFGEYDGTSWFYIEKKKVKILSKSERIS